jgi:hypothetical protein
MQLSENWPNSISVFAGRFEALVQRLVWRPGTGSRASL